MRWFAVLGLAAFLYCLTLTSHAGAFMTSDSVYYLTTAESLKAGRGFTIWNGEPYTWWPPLFPLVLTLGESVGRYVNAVAFGLTVTLSGFLASRFVRPSLAILCAACVAVSAPMVYVSGYLWSEPPFILFTVAWLLALQSYLKGGRLPWLVLAAVCASLAWQTRYIGVVALVAVPLVAFRPLGNSAVILSPTLPRQAPTSKHGRLRAIYHSLLFAAILILPMLPWYVRKLAIEGPQFYHLTELQPHLYALRLTLGRWLMPTSHDPHLALAALRWFVVILGLALAYVVTSRLARAQDVRQSLQGWYRREYWRLAPLVAFCVAYVAFLVGYEALVPMNGIDNRLLAPIFVPLGVLVVAGIEWILKG